MLHLTSPLPCTDTYTHGRGRKHSLRVRHACCLMLSALCGQARYVAFGPNDHTLGNKYGLIAEVARLSLRISIGGVQSVSEC